MRAKCALGPAAMAPRAAQAPVSRLTVLHRADVQGQAGLVGGRGRAQGPAGGEAPPHTIRRHATAVRRAISK